VRHNGRPALLASTIRPDLLNLRPGERPSMVCPACRRWQLLYRSMIAAHHPDDGPRCSGSGQRLLRDLSPDQWLTQLYRWQHRQRRRRVADPDRRHSTRVHLSPAPPVPPPVCRITRNAA
jgi:hypothetical protein